MGNFSHLARPILEKVSSFPRLAQETGNFNPKNGNFEGNCYKNQNPTDPVNQDLQEETQQETIRKLDQKKDETSDLQMTPNTFLSYSGVSSVLDYFFNNVGTFFKIELLSDDIRWLKTICYGVQKNKLKILLEAYMCTWIEAMNNEPMEHKKQNVGRLKANSILRESLSKK